MSIYSNYRDFAFDTIDENIHVVEYCLMTRKGNELDSCYGMPALILLGSIIDIIGSFYQTGSYVDITIKDVKTHKHGDTRAHFISFHNKFIGDTLDQNDFVRYLYEHARCKSTHIGVLWPEVYIVNSTSSKGDYIEITNTITRVYLPNLFELVKQSYGIMKKESLQSQRNITSIVETGYTSN